MCKPRDICSDPLALLPAASPSSRRSSSSAPAKRRPAVTRVSTSSHSTSSSSSSTSSVSSAARASLPEPPILYRIHELTTATNTFLAKHTRSRATTTAYWRCSLRGRDVALFKLQLQRHPNAAAVDAAALARIGRYHHTSLTQLLGACPMGAHLYLAYDVPSSATTLAACLRSPRNPSFTTLRTWFSRVQVAVDIAQGLDYVHHHAGAIHGRVSASTVIVSEQGLRAQLTHFGAVEFAAPADACEVGDSPYVAPGSSEPSREADIYAFGVLLLELLSGEEPARYYFDRGTKEFQHTSVLETAAAAATEGRVRTWVDRRLQDSFPVSAAERLVEVALRCTSRGQRPDMTSVAGMVSKTYLESQVWDQKFRVPSEFSVSMVPR